ncbi:MAG: ABC transporter substrate-binding protein [Actinomycetota bacterium]
MAAQDLPRRRRPLFAALVLATLAFVAATAVSAKPTTTPPPTGTFRIGTTGASWQTDPGLAYITSAWELEYATCAKLVNYPDTPWDEHEASRLRPEIAAAMPAISPDRRTYTFQIRNDFAFSPPASGVVTAASMKYTFERTLSHDLASPAGAFFRNIVGEIEYNEGNASEITGIAAQGDTLTITLIEPQGEFLTLLAMPFLCAVPTTMPPNEQFAPIPSAGPYYISALAPNVQLVATRNPNYHGPRPQRFDTLEYDFTLNEETAYQQVLSGDLDSGPLPAAHVVEVAQLYGPDSPAAARGLQQFFFEPVGCVGMLPLNTSRPLFADVNMRKAVNYAVDRTAYGEQAGPYAATPHDQYMPPGTPGYEDIQVYPEHPDIERARDLAGWHPGDPLRPITVYYRSSGTTYPAQYQIVRQNLMDIGFDVTGVPFSGGDIYTAIGTRGAPFDLAVSVGSCEDWHDPWSYIQLLDGTTIHDGQGNNNWSYFDDPVFNARMHAAEQLIGDERFDTFQQIEHDLVRDAAPWAAMRTYNNRYLFSRRMGCQHYQAAYGIDFAQLCVRPAITTDDATVLEPGSGTTTVHVPVHLSSEMDDPVTVDYATADGTAHAGADYVATSGTLTFPPHERNLTVDVVVNADSVADPGEAFFVNLANQSSGTMVDGQATVTITDTPPTPPPPPLPPPPPPPPLPPPPPPPPPPAPQVRCVVPRVIGMTVGRARARIRSKHCSVGRIRRAHSRRVGRVIRQSPRPGVRRARGARVNLVVGRR